MEFFDKCDEDRVGRILSETYARIHKQNPAYSMRSFARALDVDPAYLIRVLKGTRSASPKLAYRLSQYLQLPHKDSLEMVVSCFK